MSTKTETYRVCDGWPMTYDDVPYGCFEAEPEKGSLSGPRRTVSDALEPGWSSALVPDPRYNPGYRMPSHKVIDLCPECTKKGAMAAWLS